jgi:hypothetical protein
VRWLLHCVIYSYTHGSAEADARVKRLGYCRVHMPSIPRAGSTWFREMFEVSVTLHTTESSSNSSIAVIAAQ